MFNSTEETRARDLLSRIRQSDELQRNHPKSCSSSVQFKREFGVHEAQIGPEPIQCIIVTVLIHDQLLFADGTTLIVVQSIQFEHQLFEQPNDSDDRRLSTRVPHFDHHLEQCPFFLCLVNMPCRCFLSFILEENHSNSSRLDSFQ